MQASVVISRDLTASIARRYGATVLELAPEDSFHRSRVRARLDPRRIARPAGRWRGRR